MITTSQSGAISQRTSEVKRLHPYQPSFSKKDLVKKRSKSGSSTVLKDYISESIANTHRKDFEDVQLGNSVKIEDLLHLNSQKKTESSESSNIIVGTLKDSAKGENVDVKKKIEELKRKNLSELELYLQKKHKIDHHAKILHKRLSGGTIDSLILGGDTSRNQRGTSIDLLKAQSIKSNLPKIDINIVKRKGSVEIPGQAESLSQINGDKQILKRSANLHKKADKENKNFDNALRTVSPNILPALKSNETNGDNRVRKQKLSLILHNSSKDENDAKILRHSSVPRQRTAEKRNEQKRLSRELQSSGRPRNKNTNECLIHPSAKENSSHQATKYCSSNVKQLNLSDNQLTGESYTVDFETFRKGIDAATDRGEMPTEYKKQLASLFKPKSKKDTSNQRNSLKQMDTPKLREKETPLQESSFANKRHKLWDQDLRVLQTQNRLEENKTQTKKVYKKLIHTHIKKSFEKLHNRVDDYLVRLLLAFTNTKQERKKLNDAKILIIPEADLLF